MIPIPLRMLDNTRGGLFIRSLRWWMCDDIVERIILHETECVAFMQVATLVLRVKFSLYLVFEIQLQHVKYGMFMQ